MTEADRPEFAMSLHILTETFNEPMNDTRIAGYFAALQNLTVDQAKHAIFVAVRQCRFFPKPVELRELLEGTRQEQADSAWGQLMREVQRVGYMGTPAFTDERLLRAIKECWGSWSHMCRTLPGEGPELVGWMKQFKSTYESLAGLDATPKLTPKSLNPDIAAFLDAERRRLATDGAPGRRTAGDLAEDARRALRVVGKSKKREG